MGSKATKKQQAASGHYWTTLRKMWKQYSSGVAGDGVEQMHDALDDVHEGGGGL